MEEVEDFILDAWERVRPKLERDPAELAKRLARMRAASLSRPPREWCLAVRACDRRINEASAILVPEKAIYPRRDNGLVERHEVTLDATLLRKLCAPVTIPRGGLRARDLAKRLGRCSEDLYPTRSKGKLATEHIKGLGGVRGKPVPILSCDEDLDPGKTGLEMPDRVWGRTAVYHDSWVRDAFEQTVTRVPVYLDRTRAYRDKTHLHPEHPDVDPPPPRAKYRYPLPPPGPDALGWYKWKGDQYIGYDWRAAQTNPRIRENYERHQRRKAQGREYDKRRTPRASRPSGTGGGGGAYRQDGRSGASGPSGATGGSGSLMFRGWRWVCPVCGREAKVLLLPLAFENVLGGLMGERIEKAVKENAPPPPAKRLGGFACAKCVRVRRFSRVAGNFWNAVVGYLSGGLLYGWEVERPAWLTRERKRAYRPKANAPPAWRREQVRDGLLKGWSYQRIAAELGMKVQTVYVHAWRIGRESRKRESARAVSARPGSARAGSVS